MDNTDKKILVLLQNNARLTYKEIAKEINLTPTPVFDRIKKMENLGIIDRYVTILNKENIGSTLTVFCQVTLIKQTKEASRHFEDQINVLAEVVECNFVSGSFDYLLKVIVRNMASYHELHQSKLSAIEGVSLINSYFVMAESKSTTALPLT
jgi:Lrp/AsnC family transcriptional regulator, leucine-responsive regulatory protein